MSTEANVLDLDALQKAISSLRSDAAGISRKAWVLVGHVENNPNQVDLIASDDSEEASLEGFRDKLQDDQVMYGLIRLTTTVDMSTTVRFVYIHWSGENVPFAKKGRFGVVHGNVEQHFNPYHLLIETDCLEDLEEEEIMKRIEESSMMRSKVITGSVLGRQERGFTSNSTAVQKQEVPRSVAPAGEAVEVSQDLHEALLMVRNDKSPVRWVLSSFAENNLKKPLTVVATGESEIEALVDNLDDESVMYALYRTSDVIDEITTVKFVFIYWIGERVKPIMKGKVSAYAGPVETVFSPFHVSLSFSNRYDITEELITDKVTSSSGSKSFVK